METKKQPKNYSESEKSDSMKVSEPVALYGNNFVLNLDVTQRYTYADYLTWLDDKRRELINGFFHLMSAPIRAHSGVSAVLFNKLFVFITKKKGKCRVYAAPFDVRFPMYGSKEDDKIYDVVQPDICVICDPSKLDDKGCIGAPDMIVEVSSPSTMKYDWNRKFGLYEKAGVREYWIVSPKYKSVHVFLLQADGNFDLGTEYDGEQIVPVYIFDGLEIDLKEVFDY